jgi:hypothetical protein
MAEGAMYHPGCADRKAGFDADKRKNDDADGSV